MLQNAIAFTLRCIVRVVQLPELGPGRFQRTCCYIWAATQPKPGVVQRKRRFKLGIMAFLCRAPLGGSATANTVNRVGLARQRVYSRPVTARSFHSKPAHTILQCSLSQQQESNDRFAQVQRLSQTSLDRTTYAENCVVALLCSIRLQCS